MSTDNVSSSYLSDFVYSKEVIREFKKCVKAGVFGDFDGIVCRGVSGFLFGPTLAYLCKKKLVIVRKPNESTHSNRICEGHTDIQRYIIVDDFVSSGETLEKIVDTISDWNSSMKYIGCFFWKQNNYSNRKSVSYSRQLKVSEGKIFVRMNRSLKYEIE